MADDTKLKSPKKKLQGGLDNRDLKEKGKQKGQAGMEVEEGGATDPFLKFDPWSRGESEDPLRADLARKKLHQKEQSRAAACPGPREKDNPYKERYAEAANPFYLDAMGHTAARPQRQRPQQEGGPRPRKAAVRMG